MTRIIDVCCNWFRVATFLKVSSLIMIRMGRIVDNPSSFPEEHLDSSHTSLVDDWRLSWYAGTSI